MTKSSSCRASISTELLPAIVAPAMIITWAVSSVFAVAVAVPFARECRGG